MTMPVAGLMQSLGDLIVIGLVLGLGFFGGTSGLFIATVTAMHALITFVMALGFAQPFAGLLVSLDMPPMFAFPAAFGILAVGTAVALRLLIGHYVRADAVEFEPIIEKVGGGLLGAVAGIIVAGTLLVALSIMPLPESFRIDGTALRFDVGSGMLRTLARVAVPDPAQRKILLEGDAVSTDGDGWKLVAVDEETGKRAYPEKPLPPDPPADGSPPPEVPPPPPPEMWSEPFADLNGNGDWDAGEPYLDLLADTAFTKAALFSPTSYPDHKFVGSKEGFFVGLQERYQRQQWERWKLIEATWEDIEEYTKAEANPETVNAAENADSETKVTAAPEE
jgi:hypothetical protein